MIEPIPAEESDKVFFANNGNEESRQGIADLAPLLVATTNNYALKKGAANFSVTAA